MGEFSLRYTRVYMVWVSDGKVDSIWLRGRSDRGAVDDMFKINWADWLAVTELIERERATDIERMKTELKQLKNEKWQREWERKLLERQSTIAA